MTLQVPRWAFIVLLIAVGLAGAVAVSAGFSAYRYLHEVVGSNGEGVNISRKDLIDALLLQNFSPKLPAEKP